MLKRSISLLMAASMHTPTERESERMGYMYSPAGLFASTSSIDTSLYLVSSRLVLLHSNSTIMVKIKTLAPGVLVVLVLASSLLQTSLVTSVLALPVQSDHGQLEKVAGDEKLAAVVTRSAQSAQSTQTTAAAASSETSTGSSHPGLSRRCSRSNALKPQTKVKRHKPDSVKNYLQYHGIYKMPFLVDASEHFIEVMIAGIQNSAVFEQVKTGGMSDRVKAMHDKALERIEEWRLQPKCEDDDDEFAFEEKDEMDDIPRLRVCWWWDQLVFHSRCSQGSENVLVTKYAPDGSLHEDYLVVQGLQNTHPTTHSNTHTDPHRLQSTTVGSNSGHLDSTRTGNDVNEEPIPMDVKVKNTPRAEFERMIREIREKAGTVHNAVAEQKALQRCREWERAPDDVQDRERIIWWDDVMNHGSKWLESIGYHDHQVPGSLTYHDYLATRGEDLKGKGKARY
ncbi:hypothetical protein C8R42DRAFT_678957 [Lentinula raphanica]|nr:hypothetical protein C8R42DRAFT_678957 [Lentinula raphanica]